MYRDLVLLYLRAQWAVYRQMPKISTSPVQLGSASMVGIGLRKILITFYEVYIQYMVKAIGESAHQGCQEL